MVASHSTKWQYLASSLVRRERKKSDASGLYIDSNRRGHFIDFRVTFHVAQRAEILRLRDCGK